MSTDLVSTASQDGSKEAGSMFASQIKKPFSMCLFAIRVRQATSLPWASV
jgi:hypothetical protein